jgi:hypothetical protein
MLIAKRISAALLILSIAIAQSPRAHGQSLTIGQLNWFGLSSSTQNSAWGQVVVDFTGFSDVRYFNLNVDGVWVVQNMGIQSSYGAGINQQIATMFDLGVADGIDLSSIDYASSFTVDPLQNSPIGALQHGTVSDIDYQIGAVGGVDLGTPGDPPKPKPKGDHGKPVMEGHLPMIDKFDNQVQGPYECVPAAISNSLKYLQSTGKLRLNLDTDIKSLKKVVKWGSDGTGEGWEALKRDKYAGVLSTQITHGYNRQDHLPKIIKALKEGKDVEISMNGHVAVVAGARVYADGTVEFDLFDDNQKDNKKDPLRTVVVAPDKRSIDGKKILGFVVESAVPEPASSTLICVGALGMLGYILRHRRRAAC